MHQLNDSKGPTIFIGSSTEGLEVARIVHAQFAEYRAYVWDQGLFTPGNYPLEILDQQIKTKDFAVFICTPDDPIVKRSRKGVAVRDNVIFELGLFMGAMGRERSFILLPSHAKVELPSDLLALTQIRYDDDRFRLSYPDKIASIQSACIGLRNQIEVTWGRMQESRRKLIQSVNADKRTKSLRRLYSVIAQMRDLIIIFPAQLFNTLSDPYRFEAAKTEAAISVDKLIEAFHEDAASSDLVPEFTQLAAATKAALTGFPLPVNPSEASKAFQVALSMYAAKIIANIIASKDALTDIRNMVESEIEKQLRSFVEKYESWWKESRRAIEAATIKLQDSLFKSSIILNERLLSGQLEILAA